MPLTVYEMSIQVKYHTPDEVSMVYQVKYLMPDEVSMVYHVNITRLISIHSV